MFATHQSSIARWAQSSSDNFCDVQLLAILSARQPFSRVREQFEQVKRDDWSPLFSWKEQAYQNCLQGQDIRYETVMMIADSGEDEHDMADMLLDEVATYHGLGLVKGGFVVQMAFGLSGCFDSRNMDDLHMSARMWRSDGFARHNLTTRMRKVRKYNQAVESIGTGALWDMWCNNYAKTSSTLLTGWDVSAEHCRILGIDPGESPNDAEDDECQDIPF